MQGGQDAAHHDVVLGRQSLPWKQALFRQCLFYGNVDCLFRAVRCCVLPALLLCCTACSGPQSTLAPAGADSENIARLFFWMTGLFAFIWAAVVTLALLLPRLHSLATDKAGRLLIVGGGVVLPVTVLTVLLVFGLASLRSALRPGSDPLSIEIVGSQWWWSTAQRT